MVDFLEQWLASTYAFDDITEVKLLRAYTNDVYVVQTSTMRYVLKIYGVGWRRETDIRYEVDLLAHLAGKGVRVAQTITGKNGEYVYKLTTDKGQQFAVLFEYEAGQKPQPPFSTDLYVKFGHAIAEMHYHSDDFQTSYPRTSLDMHTFIGKPLSVIIPCIKVEDDQRTLRAITETIGEKFQTLSEQGLDWGPIHGDATLDNLHVMDDGQIVLYDFDSGGHSWRAADLQGWAYNNVEYAEKWEAFKQGYASARELKAADLEAARYLSVAWLIWGLQIDLERRILAQGEAKVAEYLTQQLEAIKAQAKLAFS